jgi:rSAM/selenodomain-associated transferase 2
MNLSVIIPTRNESLQIANLVDYLKRNGGEDLLEIIVVDAVDSKDGTIDKVPKGKTVALKCSVACRAIQMNEGAAVARGDILYFVHADVIPPQKYAKEIRSSVEKGNDFGFFSYAFQSEKIILKINSYSTRFSNIFTGGGDQTFYIKKDVFNRYNGFDSSIALMEDFDFFYRLKKDHRKYEIIHNDVLVSARKYDHNSYLKVNLVNLLTLALFKLGYAPDKLKVFYNRVLKL